MENGVIHFSFLQYFVNEIQSSAVYKKKNHLSVTTQFCHVGFNAKNNVWSEWKYIKHRFDNCFLKIINNFKSNRN